MSSTAAVGDKRAREQSTAAGSDAAAASSDRRVQPRHFHTGRNPVPGEDMLAALQDDASPSPPTTAARLYRHALESVFAFCNLKELAPLPRVSKRWAAAVQSMRPLDTWLPSEVARAEVNLLRFCMSPLARHVSKARLDPYVVTNFRLSPSLLYNLTLRMTNLQELHCRFEGSWAPVIFPARLRHLTLGFQATADQNEPFSDKQHRELDEVIAAIATLPLLESLSLKAWGASRCCLTPLLHAPALHTLDFCLSKSLLESSTTVAVLRTMPHLRSLSFFPTPLALARLLEAPNQMKLDTLVIRQPFTDEFSAAIVRLPSLTNLPFVQGSEHTDFLQQLPNLRRLEMTLTRSMRVAPDANRIMTSLHALTKLTELTLNGGGYDVEHPLRFTSDHLTACLPHMPLLTSLRLTDVTAVDSLRFLSSGPITRSLKELVLWWFYPRLPLRELAHVHALSALTSLALKSVFRRSPESYTLRLYTPPSLLLPSLRQFEYDPSVDDEEEEDEED